MSDQLSRVGALGSVRIGLEASHLPDEAGLSSSGASWRTTEEEYYVSRGVCSITATVQLAADYFHHNDEDVMQALVAAGPFVAIADVGSKRSRN